MWWEISLEGMLGKNYEGLGLKCLVCGGVVDRVVLLQWLNLCNIMAIVDRCRDGHLSQTRTARILSWGFKNLHEENS